jgi:hypothetical protein
VDGDALALLNCFANSATLIFAQYPTRRKYLKIEQYFLVTIQICAVEIHQKPAFMGHVFLQSSNEASVKHFCAEHNQQLNVYCVSCNQVRV